MGQYYTPVIIKQHKTREYASGYLSHEYGNGLKLMEHAYVGNNFTETVLKELYHSQGRLVWMGDYAEQKDFDMLDKTLKGFDFIEAYERIENKQNYKHPVDTNNFSKDKIVLNHEKEEYIDMKQYCEVAKRDDCGMLAHPIALLTAMGNGKGGGDYRGPDEELVGVWAGDTLEIVDELPETYKDYVNKTLDYCNFIDN